MSATSGIPIDDDLKQVFADAQHSEHRFLKLAIRNELIVLDSTTLVNGDFSQDLDMLQDMLDDDIPAYILARLDDAPSQWLAITYVPDAAKVRDKMLYASTRSVLTKSLGSASFPDAVFATQKSDLTPTAYLAHRRHQSAPKPLSAREQAMADVQAAERAAARSGTTDGVTARNTHLGGAGVQMNWTEEVEHNVKALASDDDSSRLVIMSIDPATETLLLVSNGQCAPNDLGAALPPSDPAYAFFVWSHTRRDIIFIYSCPSTSPIKHRMIFSSGVSSVLAAAKNMGLAIARKVETSDPQELNESFLRAELGLAGSGTDEKKPFAKPRGPTRKQR